MENSIDFARLAKLMKAKRGDRGLREIAVEIGDISPSTLSRIEGERVTDMALSTFLLICNWLKIAPWELTEQTHDNPPPDLDVADSLELQLRAAPDLDPQTARLLAEMFKAAYREAKKSAE